MEANKTPGHQREQEWTQLLFIRDVPGCMIISFYKRYYCMCGLQTRWGWGFICVSHTAGLWLCEGERERGEGNLVWVVEGEGGERKSERGQPLPPVWDWSVFPSKGHQLLTPPHPITPPPFPLPHSFPMSFLLRLTVATVCCSVPCVCLFVMCVCVCPGVLAWLIFNDFCHCLFRWATVVWPLLFSDTNKCVRVCLCVHLLAEG